MRFLKTVVCSLVLGVTLATGLLGVSQSSANASPHTEDGPGEVQVTADSIARGEGVYAARCAACHGANLGGGGHVPPLKGTSFMETWNGMTMRALYSRTVSTMPWNDPGSLSEENTIDLVAFIAQQNGLKYPNGVTRADQLNNLRIEQ